MNSSRRSRQVQQYINASFNQLSKMKFLSTVAVAGALFFEAANGHCMVAPRSFVDSLLTLR